MCPKQAQLRRERCVWCLFARSSVGCRSVAASNDRTRRQHVDTCPSALWEMCLACAPTLWVQVFSFVFTPTKSLRSSFKLICHHQCHDVVALYRRTGWECCIHTPSFLPSFQVPATQRHVLPDGPAEIGVVVLSDTPTAPWGGISSNSDAETRSP